MTAREVSARGKTIRGRARDLRTVGRTASRAARRCRFGRGKVRAARMRITSIAAKPATDGGLTGLTHERIQTSRSSAGRARGSRGAHLRLGAIARIQLAPAGGAAPRHERARGHPHQNAPSWQFGRRRRRIKRYVKLTRPTDPPHPSASGAFPMPDDPKPGTQQPGTQTPKPGQPQPSTQNPPPPRK